MFLSYCFCIIMLSHQLCWLSMLLSGEKASTYCLCHHCSQNCTPSLFFCTQVTVTLTSCLAHPHVFLHMVSRLWERCSSGSTCPSDVEFCNQFVVLQCPCTHVYIIMSRNDLGVQGNIVEGERVCLFYTALSVAPACAAAAVCAFRSESTRWWMCKRGIFTNKLTAIRCTEAWIAVLCSTPSGAPRVSSLVFAVINMTDITFGPFLLKNEIGFFTMRGEVAPVDLRRHRNYITLLHRFLLAWHHLLLLKVCPHSIQVMTHQQNE